MNVETDGAATQEVALDWLHRVTALIIALDGSAKRIEDKISNVMVDEEKEDQGASPVPFDERVLAGIIDIWWTGKRWVILDGHHRLAAYRLHADATEKADRVPVRVTGTDSGH